MVTVEICRHISKRHVLIYVSRDMNFKMSLLGLKLSVGLHSFQLQKTLSFRELCPFWFLKWLHLFLEHGLISEGSNMSIYCSSPPPSSPTVESPLSVLLLHTAMSLRSLGGYLDFT